MPVAEITLAGAHNVENVLAAVCAARSWRVWIARRSVKQCGAFRAVEHRLEFVREVGGREVLQRLEGDECRCDDEGGGLVCGRNPFDPGREGQGFGLYECWRRLLRERVRTVITIGSAAEKIERELDGVVKIESAETLAAC